MEHHKFVYSGIILYFGLIIFLLFSHNLWLSPDQFIIFALVIAIFLGRGKVFIRNWFPFIVMFLSYEALRGVTPDMTHFPVNSTNIIAVEKAIFGTIPTIWLQKHYLSTSILKPYDYLLTLVYMSHFVGFLLFAFYLWTIKSSLFRQFSYAILLLSYLAFFTFIVFPTMPPWMAGQKGLISPVVQVIYQTTPKFTSPGTLPTIYKFLRANDVAAIPSLHAAYPFLIFLFSLTLKRRLLSLFLLLYLGLVWLAVVYLGEHYIIDVIIGAIYAAVAYLIITTSPFGVISTK